MTITKTITKTQTGTSTSTSTSASTVVPFGLYVHVPYCRALCHYCDFAKTANYGAEVVGAYLGALEKGIDWWLAERGERLTSVFFGGGTPSLFGEEYERLMEGIRGRLADGAEVTLEANPEDVTKETVGVWRRLGVSRLSIGVQTFQGEGLGFLKRNHGGAAAERAIEVARSEMPTVNADLIYGWPGQTVRGWQEDLARAVAAGADHLSLYNLTYEARTPIGRAVHRGKRAPEDDDLLASYYEVACAELAARGFEHDEVSNWALPGSTCRHNWLYWQDESYVGVGAGAHGYLRDEVGPGVRWWYPRDDRQFVRAAAGKAGATVEDETNGRTRETWLTEYVGSSLRTRRGVDLGRVAAVLGREVELRPTPVLAEALARRIISIDVDAAMAARPDDGLRAASRPSPRLRLVPAEWFRENAWAVEVLGSLRR